MAGSNTADVGTGALLTLGAGAGAAWAAIEILDMSFSGAARENAESTHLATGTNNNSAGFGSRTYIAGRLSDPGELTVECNHNPDLFPPLDVASHTIVVTTIDGDGTSGATWSTNGFMTSYDVSGIGIDTKMTATAVFKLSGAIIIVPGDAA